MPAPIGARNTIQTNAIRNDLPVQTTAKSDGVYEKVNGRVFHASIGYNLKVCRRVSLQAEYLYGFTDLFDTGYSGTRSEKSHMLLAGVTWMMFVPADLSEVSTDPRAPDPSATIAITAATPMITPSMVSPVRRRLQLSARSAILAET